MNSPRLKHFFCWLPVIAIVLLLDQISKQAALHSLAFAEPKVILPFLNFTLIYNTGVSFGFLHGALGDWQQTFFITTTIAISLAITVWLYRLPEGQRLTATALSLIIGGAIGNLIDRIRFGYVIDFLSFHLGSWHFAVFNLADVAISLGAILIIATIIFERSQS